MLVFIIIPAFNEEKTIHQVVCNLMLSGYENIVVVDDGSVDSTAYLAQQAGAVVIKHMVNRGQGAALETGNEYARMNYATHVVHFDGDGQFNPKDIEHALAFLEQNQLDVVIGSRFLDSRSKIPFLKKKILFPIGRTINFLLTKLTLTDVHNGFRVLSHNALSVLRITQDRMAHNSEINLLIREKQLRYAEFPVEVKYFEYGQGIGGGLKILRDWFLHPFARND
jgi:glycosyltransferase involved in cell wall biosynthesis